jgi:hypothetical protein
MKISRCFLAVFALASLTPQLHAEILPVSVRVDQISKSDNDKTSKTQTKSLKIALSNNSAVEMTHLSVKFYFFGKDVQDKDIVVLEQGEKFSDLKPRGRDALETANFTATVKEGKPSKNKRAEDTGTKFVGYGVQVSDKGKVVGEYFSLPSLKEKVGGHREEAKK